MKKIIEYGKLSHPQIKALILKALQYKRGDTFKFEDTLFRIKRHEAEHILIENPEGHVLVCYYYLDQNLIYPFGNGENEFWRFIKADLSKYA